MLSAWNSLPQTPTSSPHPFQVFALMASSSEAKLATLFIYFWLHWVFLATHGLSLCAVLSRSVVSDSATTGTIALQAPLSMERLSLVLEDRGHSGCAQASHCGGFSFCSAQVHRLQAWLESLWRTGLVAPWHEGSSWTRD